MTLSEPPDKREVGVSDTGPELAPMFKGQEQPRSVRGLVLVNGDGYLDAVGPRALSCYAPSVIRAYFTAPPASSCRKIPPSSREAREVWTWVRGAQQLRARAYEEMAPWLDRSLYESDEPFLQIGRGPAADASQPAPCE
jgi:hypothetical protein